MDDVVSLGFDLTQLLNRTEAEALAMATAANLQVRVIERDGKASLATRDLKPSRVNLVVVDGLVSSYRLG